MGLDVWFREDVARVLRAACVAGREAHLNLGHEQPMVIGREMAAYWRGYEAALATIGTAFGLVWPGEIEETVSRPVNGTGGRG